MSDASPRSREDIRAAARLTGLDLPDDRLDQLVGTLSAYLANLNRLRAVDVGESEPPAITYEREAER
ncbi:MAG: hypothetical protein ACRD1H_21120 [Vicinamibacterales bacterium]